MIQVKIGDWTFAVSSVALDMPRFIIEEVANDLLPRWASVWPREEETMALVKFGIPSVLVRLDCVVTDEGLGVYEIEERPAGLGIACIVNSEFKVRFHSWMKSYDWNLAVVISHRRANHDDGVWASEFNVPLFNGPCPSEILKNHALLVRAEPEEEDYLFLAPHSLFPICLKGWKGYGVKLGLWEPIPDELDHLPWDKGFVTKPSQGSKMKDIFLWHPSGAPGVATRTKIENMIKSGQVAYWQRWITPEQHPFLPDGYRLIRRVYFALFPDCGWIYLGGLWNARPNFRIHGASDAIFGPVM